LSTTTPKLPSELEVLVKEEVNFKNIEWVDNKEKGVKVKLDTQITKELEEEAKARELIRKIQGERKKMSMSLMQEIEVFNPWVPEKKELLEKVKNKTLALTLSEGEFSVAKSS